MRINFNLRGKGTPEEAARNHAYAMSLGRCSVVPAGVHSTPLAVVGGGRSLREHVQELREWPGHIWAINGAFNWCQARGIDAVLFSCDPSIENCEGATRAILAQTCNPAVFDYLKDAEVKLFVIGPGGLATGPSSATSALLLAPTLGFQSVSFFGCDSSHDGVHTHAYANSEPSPYTLVVRSGGREFMTEPEYLVQAEYLAGVMNLFPHIYKNKSGGLLEAMVKTNGEYDVVSMSQAMIDHGGFTVEGR